MPAEYKGRAYRLTIGGTAYDQDAIADPVYSASAPNHGMYGIATASFSCDVYTGAGMEYTVLQLAPCSEVTFSMLDNTTFVLTDASFRSKGVVSITAYTKFINSDIIMEAKTFQEYSDLDKDKKNPLTYSCRNVAAAALSDIYGAGGSPSEIGDTPMLRVADFKGKSARSVLEEIAKVNGGYFFESSGSPTFAVNGGDSKGHLSVSEDEFSPCSPVQSKTISRVFVTGAYKNDFYEVGSGEFYNTETLSGDYLMGEAICRAAAAKMFGQYNWWSCSNILTDDISPNLHMDIDFSGKVLTAENFSVKYTKNHSVMSAGADGFSMAYTDYTEMVQRALKAKLEASKTYGNSGIDSSYGIYFVAEDDDE